MLFQLAVMTGLNAAESPRTHTIVIENMRFTPAALEVKRGERVQWVNKDFFPHTATSDDEAFDSGNIDATASWTYPASAAGEHTYGCTLHPTMKGKLTVQ